MGEHLTKFVKSNKYVWFSKDMKAYAVRIKDIKSADEYIRQVVKEPVKYGIARGLEKVIKNSEISKYNRKTKKARFWASAEEACLNLFENLEV